MNLWAGFTNALAAIAKKFTTDNQVTFEKPFSWTGYMKKDRNELIDAILTAYDNPAYDPVIVDGAAVRTFCNFACQEIAEKMGCHDLWDEKNKRARTADEIYSFMTTHTEAWREILCNSLTDDFRQTALMEVQYYANAGNLVFASLDSLQLGGAHGHICVIRPGIMKSSGKWGKVPACMNIGRLNFIALGKEGAMQNRPAGINAAFKDMPKFFVWRGGA